MKTNIAPNTSFRIVTVELAIRSNLNMQQTGYVLELPVEKLAESVGITAIRIPTLAEKAFPKATVINSGQEPDHESLWAKVDARRQMEAHRAKLPSAGSIKARFFGRQLAAEDAIKELARTFPTLDHSGWFAPRKDWDSTRFDQQFRGFCDGALHAFRFILSVWNPATQWDSGPFNLHDALSSWDADHRQAFIAWANDPWWP